MREPHGYEREESSVTVVGYTAHGRPIYAPFEIEDPLPDEGEPTIVYRDEAPKGARPGRAFPDLRPTAQRPPDIRRPCPGLSASSASGS